MPGFGRIEGLHVAVDEVLQQFSANMPIKKPMLEFVLETPETAITRRVTIFGTGFHKRQSPMKEIAPAVCDLTGESGAARQGVVEEYLCLKPARSGRRERRAILGHQLTWIDFKHIPVAFTPYLNI